MIILGVDPGLQRTGYAILRAEPLACEARRYGVIETHSKQPFGVRLKIIYDQLCQFLTAEAVDVLALEDIFYAQNIKVALKMGHVRGIALLAAANHRLPTAEYSAREIKQAVTGNGNASKFQVQRMICQLLQLSSCPESFDATDAMAVAYCHYQRMRSAGATRIQD
ncbi:MAG: crossover junction endodeoxyribonuclease RuvC [candidate division KSB1 bacterium]|nr:crossover junction endodeoxyribonuclease RuvC [candidate division KSB1 bacterium]MDZ7340383.1 crossover junction endodeoxyribonuclease RuvC [candidate division KSB1 bacterium]